MLQHMEQSKLKELEQQFREAWMLGDAELASKIDDEIWELKHAKKS